MPIETLTMRKFTCDRCPATDKFPNDAEAGLAGWTVFAINQRKDTVLCPRDSEMHHLFLAGTGTGAHPAALAFNAAEDKRFASAYELTGGPLIATTQVGERHA
jgi:hypothetical protein